MSQRSVYWLPERRKFWMAPADPRREAVLLRAWPRAIAVTDAYEVLTLAELEALALETLYELPSLS